MVGQSFEVAVLALIEALSTADVTALICSGDPLVCAIAPLQSSAELSPAASMPRKKRDAKSACGVSRVIISSQWSLTDLKAIVGADKAARQPKRGAGSNASRDAKDEDRAPSTNRRRWHRSPPTLPRCAGVIDCCVGNEAVLIGRGRVARFAARKM
jgi:hypothetical protein